MHVLTPQPEEGLWSKVRYTGFSLEILEQRREAWQKQAEELIQLLPVGNVVLLANTSVGKTVCALLTIIAGKYQRPLFLAPTKLLVWQHSQLLQKLVADSERGCVVTGETPATQRVWEDYVFPYIFATPQIVLNDYRHGKVKLCDFDLMVFDEVQDAQGDSDYHHLGIEAAKQGVPILGLSPSLGNRAEKVALLKEHLHIVYTRRLSIPTPKKTESLVEAPLTPALRAIDALFVPWLLETGQELNVALLPIGYQFDTQQLLTKKELLRIAARIKRNRTVLRFDFGRAISINAQYFKLLHAYQTVMTEGYEPFLQYANQLSTKDSTLAAQTIVRHPVFRQLVDAVKADRDNHPKVVKFIEIALSQIRMHSTFLAFVYQKATAEHLKIALKKAYAADPLTKGQKLSIKKLFGGYGKKGAKRQQQVLSDVSNGKVAGVLATSVIEKGVNCPEVGAVVHYSMPMTEIQRIQRTGRTGRVRMGTVVYICLDHHLDKVFYWSTRPQAERQAKVLSATMQQKMQRPLTGATKRRSKRCPATLELFPA